MKSKWMKISAIVAAVVVVLVAGLLILAKTLITPERVRSAVLPVAEDYLQRPVALERIEVGLFSGISCQGIVIGERAGEDDFIKAEALVLRYRFWPLLFGRVLVDEATLNRPEIRIVRDAEGRFNFDDLLGADTDGPGGTSAAERENEGAAGSSIDLLVTRLAIDNGRVEFIDQAIRPGQAVVTRLDGLNLSAQDLSLERAFPVDLDFRLNDAPISWSGSVDPSQKGLDGRLQVTGLSAGPLAPYGAAAFPGELRTLQLDADLQIDGGEQSLNSRGEILLDKIGLTLNALPEYPIEDARVRLEHDMAVDLDGKRMTIRSFRAEYNRIALEAQDGFVDYGTNPELDIELRLPRISASDIVASLPAGLAGDTGDLAPSGSIEAELHLLGNPSSLETLIADGFLSLQQAGMKVGHLQPRLSGTVDLENDGLAGQGMQLDVAGSQFLFDLSAKRLFGETKYAAVDIRSEEVDFNAFLAPEKEEAGSSPADTPPAGAAGKKEQRAEPLDLPLEMDGKVRIATARYRGLNLEDVQLDWRLADNVVRFENIGAAAASGRLDGKAVLDLGRQEPSYNANIQVRDVAANALVTALAPRAADTVFGQLDLSANLGGSGTQSSAVKQNLTGSGQFEIRQGELTGAGIMESLAAFLDLKDLRVFRFALGKGTFKIRDGIVNLDSSFDGSQARLRAAGRIGLDQSLDLSVRTLLSPENTEKLAGTGTLGEVISDEEGWGLIPLKITGSFADPSVSLDRKAMTEQVRKGAEKKVKEKLQEKVLEELGVPPEDGEEEPAKKLLKDTLRGLFGN